MQSFQDFKATKSELAELIGSLAEQSKAIGLNAVTENLLEWKGKIQENKFRLLFLGDFKRGKSTTINAFLGDTVLPSDMKPCTGGITLIRHGDPPHAEAFFWDANRPPQRMSLEEFKQRVVIRPEHLTPSADSGNIDHREALDKIPYKELILYAPLSLCKEGVEFVDSPGLDEDKRRTELTTTYVSKSDCGVFILAANQLLSEGERDNIKSFRLLGLKDMFFIVNFWDMVQDADDPEKEARDLKERIRTLLPGERNVFYVSARNALRGKKSQDQKKVEASGFPTFENAMVQFLTHDRARIVLDRYRGVVELSATSILEAVEQRRGLVQQSLAEVQQRFDEAQPRLNTARQRQEQIREKFTEIGGRTARTAGQAFNKFCDELSEQVKEESKQWEAEGATRQLVAASYQKSAHRFLRTSLESWSATTLRDTIFKGVQAASHDADVYAIEVVKDMMLLRNASAPESSAGQFDSDTQKRFAEAMAQECDAAAPSTVIDAPDPAQPAMSKMEAKAIEAASYVGGATIGAAIGTAIIPVVGTFLGYMAGLVAGAAYAGNVEDKAGHAANRKFDQEPIRAAVLKSAVDSIAKLKSTESTEVGKKVAAIFDEHQRRYEEILSREIHNTESQITEILQAKKEKSLEVEPELKRLDEVATNISSGREAAKRLIANYGEE